MDQETRWLNKYNEVKTFIEVNHRNPSRHRIEEHLMLNWEEQGDGYLFHRKTKSAIINS